MNEKQYCCPEFAALVANEEVRRDRNSGKYYLHTILGSGSIRFISANFCPFCGANLRPHEPELTPEKELERRR